MSNRFLIFAAAASTALLAACGTNDSLAPEPKPADAEASPSYGYGGNDRDGGRSTAVVINTQDAGKGSFRAAIESANSDPSIRKIKFDRRLGTIYLKSTVHYTGAQNLDIDGEHATVDAAGLPMNDGNGFVATGGGDIDVEDLKLVNAPGNGLVVAVPGGASGVVKVKLDGVSLQGNGLYGLLVDDQLPVQETFAPKGADSDASIYFEMRNSVVADNGKSGPSDFDGARVQEGGNGGIVASIVRSRIERNGADGVEYDERGEGNVDFVVYDSRFTDNGPQDPNDLDDGFDIDEIGGGDVRGLMVNVVAEGNFDQGLDFDEEEGGSLRVTLINVQSRNNGQEAIKMSESGDGDVTVVGNRVTGSASTNEEGAVFEEEDAGDIRVQLANSEFNGNKKENLEITEAGDGSIEARLFHIVANASIGDEGILIEEGDAGNVDATLTRVTADSNKKEGLEVTQDQQPGDTGALVLRSVTLSNNAVAADPNDDLTAQNVTVTTIP